MNFRIICCHFRNHRILNKYDNWRSFQKLEFCNSSLESKIKGILGIAGALGLLGVANNMVTKFRGCSAIFGQFPVKPLFHGKLISKSRKNGFEAIFRVSRVIERGQ